MTNDLTVEFFYEEDKKALQSFFMARIKENSNFLFDSVPNISSIQWFCEQVDEDCYAITDFSLQKNNGYSYSRTEYKSSEPLSLSEFNPPEIELIESFTTYLQASSRLMVSIFGSKRFSFISENSN